MTLAQFPKSDFLNFRWNFFPKMTLVQFPVFGFFFQDSRIGVKRRESRESQKIYSRKSWIYKYLVEPLNNKHIKHVNHYYILFIPVYNIRRQQIVNLEQFEKKYLNYLGTILAFCYENRKKSNKSEPKYSIRYLNLNRPTKNPDYPNGNHNTSRKIHTISDKK